MRTEFPNLALALRDYAEQPRPGHPAQEAYAWAVKYEKELDSFRPPGTPLAYRARMATGLTQAEFAKEFGFNLHTVRKWERGARVPRGRNHTDLIRILGGASC